MGMGTENRVCLFFPRRFRVEYLTFVVSLVDFRGEFEVLLSAATGDSVSAWFVNSLAMPKGSLSLGPSLASSNGS